MSKSIDPSQQQININSMSQKSSQQGLLKDYSNPEHLVSQKTSSKSRKQQEEHLIDVRRSHLDQIFAERAQINRDFSDLKKVLLQNSDISQIIRYYKNQLGTNQFNSLRNLLESQELVRWKQSAHKNQRSHMDGLSVNGDLEEVYEDWKRSIFEKRETIILRGNFRQELSKKQLKSVKIIISSEDLKEWFGQTQSQQTQSNKVDLRETQISKLFHQIKIYAFQLSRAMLRCQSQGQSVEIQEDQFPRRQLKLIKEIIQSKRFKILLEKDKSDYERKRRKKIKDIFRSKPIKSDISQLITALIARNDPSSILQKLEYEIAHKQFKMIQDLLKSRQIKELLEGMEQKELELDEMFNKFKIDTKRLKDVILNQGDFKSLLKDYEDELSKKDFGQIKNILNSKRFAQIKAQIEELDKKEKLNKFFDHKKLNLDIGSLVDRLLNEQKIQKLLQDYSCIITKPQSQILQELLNSKQLQEIQERFKDKQLYDIKRKIKHLLKQYKIIFDISDLIQILLKDQNYSPLISEYQHKMKSGEFKEILTFLSSKELKEILQCKNKKIKKHQLVDLFKFNGIQVDLSKFIEDLLNQEDIYLLIQQLEGYLPGKVSKTIINVIKSKQFIQVLGFDKFKDEFARRTTKDQYTDIQIQKWVTIQSLFEGNIQSNIPQLFDLKRAIIEKRSYSQITNLLNTIKGKLSEQEYLNIQNLINSQKLKIELKKCEIKQWRKKFDALTILVPGFELKKKQFIESLIINTNYNSILEEIIKKQAPHYLIEFNKFIQSQDFSQFFEKNKLIKPAIIKKHLFYLNDRYDFVVEGTPLSQIRQHYKILDDYKFYSLNNQLITNQENFTTSLKILRASEFSILFQGESKQILLYEYIKLNDAKEIIKKFLNTSLQIEILVYKNYNYIQQTEEFVIQPSISKKLSIAYYINLILFINEQDNQRQFEYKALSYKSVLEIKEQIADMIQINKQSQKWSIDDKKNLKDQQTLESLGIKQEYFRITIVQEMSMEYYGFTTNTNIKREQFKGIFIEDDEIFCENIINAYLPNYQYSQTFRNQILRYIFSAIKKRTPIEGALNHIRRLFQSSQMDDQLWKSSSSDQISYFNEIFVLHYILRCSDKPLRIDILRGVSNTAPVPLTYHDEKGRYVELMEENYWIQNKAFNIVSIGLGNVLGKSQLLNLIFETRFKDRTRVHKYCQGGVEVEYNIYRNEQYIVNLIDVSNDVQEDVKLSLVKASNLIIIQAKKKAEEVKNWYTQQKLSVPMILILRDVDGAFDKKKKSYRSQWKKINEKDMDFNMFEVIPQPASKMEFYEFQINQFANGVQQFVRKNYERSAVDNHWKFTDFLAERTNEQYVKFNRILKDIEKSDEDFTKISNYFVEYKKIEGDIEKDNQEEKEGLKQINIIKKKAIKRGLAYPFKRIISFYRKNSSLSSQIMRKLRMFLNSFRFQVFKEFRHLSDLLTVSRKNREGSDLSALQTQVIDKLKSIKNLKDSWIKPDVINQIDEFISKSEEFKSTKDWETFLKKIKSQYEFQIEPNALSVQNFWREVICLSKFDPNYQFKVDNEIIRLNQSIINLGRKQAQDSQSFQVINGDLLEIPSEYLQNILENQQNKKVMVVTILGPSSQEKSTLLSFVLGYDISSSVGRSKKGIYGTYLQIPNKQMPNCEAILLLDPQGIFSSQQNNQFASNRELDKKFVLFCLQASDLIILNTNGEITKDQQDILEDAYDSQLVDSSNLPELYIVINNLGGGQLNLVQYNQIEKLCETIIRNNPQSVKFVNQNHIAGVPMKFNQTPRNTTTQFIGNYLNNKTLPSQRFYRQTKNLSQRIMEVLTQRGKEREGRTLKEVVTKIENTWPTISESALSTKRGSNKIRDLELKMNLWSKRKKQQFVNSLTEFKEELKQKKLVEIDHWSEQKQNQFTQKIQKGISEFQSTFSEVSTQEVLRTFANNQSSNVQQNLNGYIKKLKKLIKKKKDEEQIRILQKKWFELPNDPNKVNISEEQKKQKFEEEWNKGQKQIEEKINRKSIAQQSYQRDLDTYNQQLDSDTRGKKIKIAPKDKLKDKYQLQLTRFVDKLKEKFQSQIKNKNIFDFTNKRPVINIGKTQGDINFNYLDMSKYFESDNTVKQEYSGYPIFQKYGNKDYNNLTKDLKDSNFIDFIKKELRYQQAFEDIQKFAEREKLEEREENQATRKIIDHTNQIRKDMDNDLKQVSLSLKDNFITELHSFSYHLLWKLRQQQEWKKKQKIIDDFRQKKEQEKDRFVRLESGNANLQNLVWAQLIMELYVKYLNKLSKADRQKRQKELKNIFKKTYTREYVQIKSNNQLNDKSRHQNERQNGIYKYLLTPVEYFKDKYEQYQGIAVQDLKNYSYSQHTRIIEDLLQSVIEFKNKTPEEILATADEIFNQSANETKSSFFILLFVEVLKKGQSPSQNFQSKLKSKMKAGKQFKIDRTIKQKQNETFLSTLQDQNIRVTNLKIFLDILGRKLSELKERNQGLILTYTPQEVNDFQLSLSVTICSATCPCCKRICDIDLQIEPNHTKHRANHGHQMRAARGMRIIVSSDNNSQNEYFASIQRCEDINSESIFNFNGKDYTWQQFRNERERQWDLTFHLSETNQARFSDYWETAGRKICEYYTNIDGIPMNFLPYTKQNIARITRPSIRPTNFIFALDESGSMGGLRWNNLIQAITASISDIAASNQCKNQYLSIFKFNDSTTPVCQFVSPEVFNTSQINFGGGGTKFIPAFSLAIQIIQRHSDVDTVFVFISDGEASDEYPTQQIALLQQLQVTFITYGKTLEYVSIFIGQGSERLEQIKNELKGRHDNVANSANMRSIFKEVLIKSKKP